MPRGGGSPKGDGPGGRWGEGSRFECEKVHAVRSTFKPMTSQHPSPEQLEHGSGGRHGRLVSSLPRAARAWLGRSSWTISLIVSPGHANKSHAYTVSVPYLYFCTFRGVQTLRASSDPLRHHRQPRRQHRRRPHFRHRSRPRRQPSPTPSLTQSPTPSPTPIAKSSPTKSPTQSLTPSPTLSTN